MLELRDIKKVYKVGDIETGAINGISVSFREKEFVAILGESGSGKTTFLNIIGGLDRYDSGELIIKGKSTKDFKEREWDAYRNNSVGFVFQSYNLISHLSIVANVELGMTLSGVSRAKKHQRAVELLIRVGLKDHLHKKPNQLSGGQMQRVAIARALANDPEILLCDEPTGALDSQTSTQIMDLIKELSADRLVIMVTHNPSLAEKYADRIITFEDGKIKGDTDPYDGAADESGFSLKKTSMSFFTALSISFNNIRTKKTRTFLTSFASSIGIIGIALVLSLSSGFQAQIDAYQTDALAEFPVYVSPVAQQISMEDLAAADDYVASLPEQYPDTDRVFLYASTESLFTHKNEITQEYMDYIGAVDPGICSSVGSAYLANINTVTQKGGTAVPVSFGMTSSQTTGSMANIASMSMVGLSTYPKTAPGSETDLEKNSDLLYGSYPQSVTDLVLVVNTRNRIDVSLFGSLGFDTGDREEIGYSEIVGKEYRLIFNDDYYIKSSFGTYMPRSDYSAMLEEENGLTLRICGIVRVKEDTRIGLLNTGVAYSEELMELVIENAESSEIVSAQRESDTSVFTGVELKEDEKEQTIAVLGGSRIPYMVFMYPVNFESKDRLTEYLDAYNEGRPEEEQIIYTDLAESISDMTGSIIDGITFVLIAFAAVSLFVSLIMICIITYTSVLERTREIGILKSLGARKKDIARVFDAETCILGVFSGVLGVVIAWALTFPVNALIYNVSELENVAQLKLSHAVLLVVVSTALTMLGGHIPAKMASRKNAVDALRSE